MGDMVVSIRSNLEIRGLVESQECKVFGRVFFFCFRITDQDIFLGFEFGGDVSGVGLVGGLGMFRSFLVDLCLGGV